MLSLTKKSSRDELVGLEIEADSVAVVEVRGNGSEVTASAVAALPPGAFADGEVTEPAAVAETLRAVFAEHKLTKRVRLGVANQRVVVRTMRLPAIEDPDELAAAVRFQAEEQIPMPVDQAVLDHRVIGGAPASEDGPATVDVVVSAARRDMITTALKPLRDAGLEPVGIDLSAFGLIRALGAPLAPNPDDDALPPATVLYCNVADNTNLAIARGRSCVFTRVSPAGLDDIAAGLAGESRTKGEARILLSQVGLAAPVESLAGDPTEVAEVRAALERGASALVDEIRLTLDFYGAQQEAEPIERVALGGPGAAVAGLAEWMSPSLGLPIDVAYPPALAGLDPAAAARLTLPYGLALEE